MATRPERETLTTRKTSPTAEITLEQILPLDVEELMLNPKFRRFMLTLFQMAGMYTGSFHSEAGLLHFSEGRRSLGLDILRTLERFSGADAHIRILQEASTLKEANNGRRDYQQQRRSELGGNDDRDDDGRDPEPGILRYDRPVGGDAGQG